MSPADVVTLSGWRWSRGMTAIRMVAGACDSGRLIVEDVTACSIPVDGSWLPDTDPATLGCLLALVEAATGATIVVWPCAWDGDAVVRWEAMAYRRGAWHGIGAGPTKWDALVAALAAAPGRAS